LPTKRAGRTPKTRYKHEVDDEISLGFVGKYERRGYQKRFFVPSVSDASKIEKSACSIRVTKGTQERST